MKTFKDFVGAFDIKCIVIHCQHYNVRLSTVYESRQWHQISLCLIMFQCVLAFSSLTL